MTPLLLTTMAFAQISPSFEDDKLLKSFDTKIAPVLATGCTVEKDAYHEQPKSFALIHYNGETSLMTYSANRRLQILAGEAFTEEGRFWELANGGVWSTLYARDIWESLIDTPFTYYDKAFTSSDLQSTFQQKPCAFNYEQLNAYTKNPLNPPSP